ncbi:HemK2/MTQ2 family protein methyltransferase [Streptomyces chumphonensis]|uniref:HemK2/MTQ2 family protein methyltransferase n=1 Tax=Streptomyces chumphonensis TaxID=1214925 RepID=UPI003D75D6A2
MLLIRPPGVYAPQSDTWLLRHALRASALAPGARVLDLCTGTGVLALAASRLGAADVVAVDRGRRAVTAARCNAGLRRAPMTVRRGDLTDAVPGSWFDVVLANPPYLPSPTAPGHRPETWTGGGRRWNGGPDGRAVIDRLCARVPPLLADGGAFLMVHSGLCDTEVTRERLRDQGLRTSVAARCTVPFGPELRSRARWLEAEGLIAPAQREEELVVIRGDRV